MTEQTFRPRRLTPSMDGLYVDTKYGPIKVWADKNGIYIDLYDRKEGDICLASLCPEDYGFSSSIYENYGSVFPTKTGMFREVEGAYGRLMLDDDELDEYSGKNKRYFTV